jgi:hypothetical protein
MSRAYVIEDAGYSPSSQATIQARAARMVGDAILYCRSKQACCGEGEVAGALKSADPRVDDCFRHSLSLQAAEYLAGLDERIVGAYSYSYGDSEEEGEERGHSPTAQLRLILHVRRKTAALAAAVAALDEALLEEYRRLIAPRGNRMTSILDVQVVDDEEVESGTGFAVVLRSTFAPPTRIWPG